MAVGRKWEPPHSIAIKERVKFSIIVLPGKRAMIMFGIHHYAQLFIHPIEINSMVHIWFTIKDLHALKAKYLFFFYNISDWYNYNIYFYTI